MRLRNSPMHHLLYLLKLGQAELCTQLLPWHPTQGNILQLGGRMLQGWGFGCFTQSCQHQV